MSDLDDELAVAEARVAALKREIAAKPCREVGHIWVQMGGRWCGCYSDLDGCSLPVMECTRCGDCDYGDGPEGEKVKAACGRRERERLAG